MRGSSKVPDIFWGPVTAVKEGREVLLEDVEGWGCNSRSLSSMRKILASVLNGATKQMGD